VPVFFIFIAKSPKWAKSNSNTPSRFFDFSILDMTTNTTKRMFSLGRQTFEYLADLEWFDGALISLFRDVATRELFVLHWVDLADDYHRWLFFPVSPDALRLYLEHKLSKEELLTRSRQEDVFVLDMNADTEFEIGKVEKQSIASLPASYRPSPKGFFKASLCPDLAEIQALLETYPTERLRAKDAALLPTA
jgi:hypothetical protein